MDVSAQVLLALLGFSLYNAYFRWYWDKNYISKQKSILFTIIIFLLFQLLLFYLLVLSFRIELSTLLFESPQHAYLIQLLLFVSGFETFGVLISTLLRLKEKSIHFTILQLVKLVIGLLLTVYLIVIRNHNIEAVYEAQLISNFIYFILIFNIIRNNIQIKFEWEILKQMLIFSMPLVLSSISGIFLSITDRYSLRFMADLASVGIYSLGYKIANTIRVFIMNSVNMAVQPVIFKMMDASGNKRFYSKVMTYYTFGLIFFVLFFALFATEIVKVISSRMEYWEASKIIPVLSFAMIFIMLKDIAFTGLNITRKTRIIALLIVVVSLLNLGLNIFFIKSWGLYGAAYATSLSQVIYFIIVYYTAQRYFHIPYELKKIVLMILVSIILYFISLLLGGIPLAIRLLFKLILIGIFPIVLYWFGFYDKIELERLSQLWNKWRNPKNWHNNLINLNLH